MLSSQLDQEMNGLLSPRCLKIHPKNVKLVQFDALLIDCTYNQILLICREKNTRVLLQKLSHENEFYSQVHDPRFACE